MDADEARRQQPLLLRLRRRRRARRHRRTSARASILYGGGGNKGTTPSGTIDEHLFVLDEPGHDAVTDRLVAQVQPGIACTAAGCTPDYYLGHHAVAVGRQPATSSTSTTARRRPAASSPISAKRSTDAARPGPTAVALGGRRRRPSRPPSSRAAPATSARGTCRRRARTSTSGTSTTGARLMAARPGRAAGRHLRRLERRGLQVRRRVPGAVRRLRRDGDHLGREGHRGLGRGAATRARRRLVQPRADREAQPVIPIVAVGIPRLALEFDARWTTCTATTSSSTTDGRTTSACSRTRPPTQEGANPLCGDRITLQLRVPGGQIAGGRVHRPRLRDQPGLGLAPDRRDQGQDHRHRRRDRRRDVLDLLGIEISPARMKCALLSLETLQGALEAPARRPPAARPATRRRPREPA